MKSAYELAMERLQQQDRKKGVAKRKALSPEQKERIAALRREADAKKAELRILREQRFAEVARDPGKLSEEEAHYETDLRRVDSWLEEKLKEVREGS